MALHGNRGDAATALPHLARDGLMHIGLAIAMRQIADAQDRQAVHIRRHAAGREKAPAYSP
jgi:hypothetical protein